MCKPADLDSKTSNLAWMRRQCTINRGKGWTGKELCYACAFGSWKFLWSHGRGLIKRFCSNACIMRIALVTSFSAQNVFAGTDDTGNFSIFSVCQWCRGLCFGFRKEMNPDKPYVPYDPLFWCHFSHRHNWMEKRVIDVLFTYVKH